MTASILNIEQISLAFGGVKALTDVSFSVKKGSVFSICLLYISDAADE